MSEQEQIQTPAEGTPNPAKMEEKSKEGAETLPKPLTPEEHQAELDRVAAKTRSEEKEKAAKEIEKARAEARAEGERQARLSEEERNKELAAQKERENAERERTITLRENRIEATEKLNELGIPTKFVDILVDHDKDVTSERIQTFAKEFKAAVSEEVAKLSKPGAPKDPSKPNSGSEDKKVQTYF